MPEHELWITALFNKYLAGFANAVLSMAGMQAENPAKPWADFITLQIFVAALLILIFGLLRPRLSMDRPGMFQHMVELLYQFLRGQADEVVGHAGRKHLHYFGTLFLFIVFCNLLGTIPTFEPPTMYAPVPLGCALVTFVYYNSAGVRTVGPIKYMKHFVGPIPAMAPLMIPIEILSHVGRLLSLTVRLYANMFAGTQATLVFLFLVPVAVPALFMGLKVFVGFLQAFVFTLLTMIYVSGAVAEEH